MNITATLTGTTDTRIKIGKQSLLTGTDGKTYSPMHLLCASIASCVATTMGVVAEGLGVDVTGVTVDIDYTMQQRPLRVSTVDIAVNCPVAVTPAQRKALESAAGRCPVKQSLHPDITVNMAITFAD